MKIAWRQFFICMPELNPASRECDNTRWTMTIWIDKRRFLWQYEVQMRPHWYQCDTFPPPKAEGDVPETFERQQESLSIFLPTGVNRAKDKKQVAQGQYLVSDTRCPALQYCEIKWEEAGQRPRRGQSPVEHRGTFVAWGNRFQAWEGRFQAWEGRFQVWEGRF